MSIYVTILSKGREKQCTKPECSAPGIKHFLITKETNLDNLKKFNVVVPTSQMNDLVTLGLNRTLIKPGNSPCYVDKRKNDGGLFKGLEVEKEDLFSSLAPVGRRGTVQKRSIDSNGTVRSSGSNEKDVVRSLPASVSAPSGSDASTTPIDKKNALSFMKNVKQDKGPATDVSADLSFITDVVSELIISMKKEFQVKLNEMGSTINSLQKRVASLESDLEVANEQIVLLKSGKEEGKQDIVDEESDEESTSNVMDIEVIRPDPREAFKQALIDKLESASSSSSSTPSESE